MRRFLAGCAISFFVLPSLADSSSLPSSHSEKELLPAPLLQISETEAFSRYVLLVDKEQRKLSVFERNGEKIKKIEEYPADIGKNGGNKTKRDDHKTPEGIYFLGEKLTQPAIPFSLYGILAFTTNYPNIFDKRENKTGSGIWLHAVPDETPLTRGSRGCVVVRNDVIKKLDEYVKLGETPILIFDQVNYIAKEEHEKRRREMNTFIENWRRSWENQEIDQYMSFYDADFKAPGGYNFRTWKNHKTNLKSKYEFIKVHFSQPYIVQHNDQLVVKTLQRYESDKHVDYGVKTIYALKEGNSFKIIREEWAPFNEQAVTAAIAQRNDLRTPSQSKQ